MNAAKIFAVAILIVVFALEWLEYSLMPCLFWPKFSSGHRSTVKILIVADPQLLGYKFSSPNIFGFICRWDSDKYISRTFSLAYNHVNPDLVIFLGDNLDEGEIASDEEFYSYLRRFKRIFQEVNFDKAMIIPGDNDIGGENEPPLPGMERRFNKYFREDIFTVYRFVEFVKINYITHSNDYQMAPNISDGNFRVALSHIPLTNVYSSFVSRVIPYIQPHMILSAHDHKSVHLIAERRKGTQIYRSPSSDISFFSFNITETLIHEIMVPTCSYRMGTDKMGYGALKIDHTGEVSYVVLWLPSRFRQLLIYGFLLGFIFIFCILYLFKTCLKINMYRNYYSRERRGVNLFFNTIILSCL